MEIKVSKYDEKRWVVEMCDNEFTYHLVPTKSKSEAIINKEAIESFLTKCEGKDDQTSEKNLRVCEVISGAWISLKKQLPNDDDYCLFVMFDRGIIITCYFEQYSHAKKFRKYELEHQYTHWIKMPIPPRK